MTLEITINIAGLKPVATRTYRLPFFKTPPWSEELYIVDEPNKYIALYLEKVPQKDGIKDKVLEYGLLRRIGRDEFLQLVEGSIYAELEQMHNAALQKLNPRVRTFYETHPLIGKKAMEQTLEAMISEAKKIPGWIDGVVNDAQRFAEYIKSHEDDMMMVSSIGKKQHQVAVAFNQESWDILKRALSEYFLFIQGAYFKTK